MSPTEKLRAMLDERGVGYDWTDRLREVPSYQSVIWWFNTADRAEFREYHDGSTQLLICSSKTHLTPAQAIAVTLGPVITGETSDGYHTFNELYHHRAVLFSVIVRDHADLAWKSKLHHDGTMYDGMFIVGIETPQGQATYHYDIDPCWDMFECKELDRAPEWDGHTPDEAIARIAALGDTDATCERQGDVDLKAENAKLRELVGSYDSALNRLCDQMQGHVECSKCVLGRRFDENTCALDELRKASFKLGVEVAE